MWGSAKLGFVIIGPHSAFTNWVFEAAKRLCQRNSLRPVRQIDREDEIDSLVPQRPLYLTNYPSQSVIDAIETGDLGVIFVIEDPRDVCCWQQHALGLPFMESLRAQTATAVANLAVAHAETVVILDRQWVRSARTAESAIAAALQISNDLADEAISVAPAAKGDISLEAALAARGDHYTPSLAMAPRLPPLQPEAAVLASSVIDPLIAMARGDAFRPVVWPSAIFSSFLSPGGRASGKVNVAGPPRALYYGPYLHLPPARYRVEAILDFSEDLEHVPFTLELHGRSFLAKARIEKRRAGGYRGYFLFDHTDPIPTLEIRLRNDEGVARGELSLIELLFFVEPCEKTLPAMR